MATKNGEMTTIRVPKKVVQMIDEARSGGLPKLSQTQMATKAIIDGLKNFCFAIPQGKLTKEVKNG